jgi:hypothetical protein
MPPSLRKTLVVLLTVLAALLIVGAVVAVATDPRGFDPTVLLLAVPAAGMLLGTAAMLRYIPNMTWYWTATGFLLVGTAVLAEPLVGERWLKLEIVALALAPLADYVHWRHTRARARRLQEARADGSPPPRL